MHRIEEQAPAKINLALHVTGQRPDGYHLLDMLVTFTDIGDRLVIQPAEADGFSVSGPFAAMLQASGDPAANLVLKARDRLRAALQAEGHACPPVHLHLEKNLPVASGIGGGSADAAAALRGLQRLWQAALTAEALAQLALSLGADVPMCLVSRPLLARGVGEEISALPLPSLPMLLVNPLIPVSTPRIFQLLTRKDNPPIGEIDPTDDPVGLLRPLRNDLQPPAEALEPVIAALCAEMVGSGARIARMSGSGATCFGIFSSFDARDSAAAAFRSAHPGWFVAPTSTLP